MTTDKLSKILLDASPMMILIWDEHLRLEDCNQKTLATFGVSSHAELVSRFHEFSSPHHAYATPSSEKRGDFLRKAFERGSRRIEWVYTTPDERELPLECFAVRVDYDGTPMLIEYMLDMTARVNADSLMHVLVDTFPIATVVFNENGDIIEVNRAAIHLHRLSSKAAYIENFAKTCPELQPCGTPTREKLTQQLEKGFMGYTEPFLWMHHTWDTHKPLPVEVTMERVYTSGGYVLVVYWRDLREEHKMREAQAQANLLAIAEESNRAKDRFLARMSHEIRTPLTSVIGVSDIHLRNAALPLAVNEAFSQINYSAGQLLSIVNDILDLSKIENGHIKMTSKKYITETSIRDTVNQHSVQASRSPVKFVLKIDENLPAALIGDYVRIEQIVNNLLSNAFKYTAEGQVTLSVRAQQGGPEDDGCMLIITVADTGVGMSAEQVAVLFDEYTRFHDRKDFIRGTGLGMAIVRSLCGAMRATIDVFSTPGQGTQVTVHVPQRVAGTDVIGAEGVARLQNFEMRPSKHEERQEFTPESMPYGSVLVVDDVRANLYVTRGLLQFYDLHTITCESAAECIALIEGGAVFDVIFMDHMMPEMDGTDALRALRSMGYNEPVVVLTANALLGHAEQFLHDGFDGYLSKPVRSEQLDAILRRYIRDKQPPHVLEEAKNNSEGKVRMSGFDKFQTHPELLTRLRKDFRDEQQHVMSDLRAAISNNDIKKAHFLAHTLKGRAGLLYESALVSAAEVAEIMLRDGNSVPEATLVALENELTRVIASIPSDAPPADHAAALAALDALQPLLAARSGKCRTHLDELRDIPQAAILVQLVENFDFATAEKCLPVVRKLLS